LEFAALHPQFWGLEPQVYEPGAGGLQTPDSGKAIIFRAKAKFFGQKPAAKIKEIVFIKRKNGICWGCAVRIYEF